MSAFLQVTLNFELVLYLIVVYIFTQILLTLLIFIASLKLQNVSICRGWIIFGVCNYVNVQFTP